MQLFSMRKCFFFFYVDHIWPVGKEILTHLDEDRFVKSIYFYFKYFLTFFLLALNWLNTGSDE